MSDGNADTSQGDSSGGQSVQLSENDIAAALVSAFQARNVAIDDNGVSVSTADGLYQLSARISAQGKALPQVPDDTSGLDPGSVEGAAFLVLGSVQVTSDATRVSMRLVVVETSEIKETGTGDASGAGTDAIQAAAEDALAGLPTLNAQ